MKPSLLASALDTCFRANRPACIWGPPGIGKSQIMHQVGQTTNREVKDVRAVLLDPVDLRGLPHVNGDNRAHWAIPEFLPRDGAGILFFDELNRAPALVQNACLQIVLDRKLGEYVLPPDWRVAAACNRESDGGGIVKMNSALSSRFVNLDAETDLDEWGKWAITHDIEPAVIAFLRFRPELLHSFDRTSRSFPCPRSWEFVSNITAQNPGKDLELALFTGTVGEGAAIEYAAFLQLFRNIPSIDAILLNPDKADVPTKDPGSLWAISSALARRATDQNLRRVVTYIDRMPAEYAVLCIKDAVGRDSSLTSTPDFTKWALAHSDVVF